MQGVERLMDIVNLIKDRLGHEVQCRLLVTMFDSRLKHSFSMLGKIKEQFQDILFSSIIHVNVKLKESIVMGQTVTTEISRGEVDLYRFHGESGDSLSLKFKAGKTGDLQPEIRLFQHDATEVQLPPVTGGKLSVKLVLQRGGTQYLAIRGLNQTAGTYSLGLKLKLGKPDPRVVEVPGVLGIKGPQGAVLSLKGKAEKGSGVEPGIDSFEGFDGTDHLDPATVTEKGGTLGVKGQVLPYDGEFQFEEGDRALVFTLTEALPELERIFRGR